MRAKTSCMDHTAIIAESAVLASYGTRWPILRVSSGVFASFGFHGPPSFLRWIGPFPTVSVPRQRPMSPAPRSGRGKSPGAARGPAGSNGRLLVYLEPPISGSIGFTAIRARPRSRMRISRPCSAAWSTTPPDSVVQPSGLGDRQPVEPLRPFRAQMALDTQRIPLWHLGLYLLSIRWRWRACSIATWSQCGATTTASNKVVTPS